MSILIVGASHRTAPIELLERLAIDASGIGKLRAAALDSEHVTEALVLSTCNRIEIYAEVDRFHGSVEDLTGLLAAHAGLPLEQMVPSLYVHYDEAAVAHLFEVATGLDSMVMGESQILGQVRDSLRAGQADESVATSINALFQQGLRVGKRAHSETGIDRAGQSVVSVALDDIADVVGSFESATVCIVGAGSVAALAAGSVRRRGTTDVILASRTFDRAARLAERVEAQAVRLDDLDAALARADLVISCTTASQPVVTTAMIQRAMAGRGSGATLAIVDLALPHDVDPAVGELDGVTLVALHELAQSANSPSTLEDVTAVRLIVADEVAAFSAARAAARVAPTVVALRSMATGVVAAEGSRRGAVARPVRRDRADRSPGRRQAAS
jgi:glutamyl-tRNA reductase